MFKRLKIGAKRELDFKELNFSSPKQKIKKRIKVIVVILSLLLLTYLGGSLYFMNHFYFNTVINGNHVGKKTILQVENYMKERTRDYSLVLQGREEVYDNISSQSIGLELVFDGSLEEILENQNCFLWVSSIWKVREYDIEELTVFKRDKMEQQLKNSILFQNSRKPKDAYVGEYSIEYKKFPLVEADRGTTLIYNKVRECVEEALDMFADTIVLEDMGCYVEPSIPSEDKKLNGIVKELNKYVSARIQYDWNGAKEVIDGDQIKDWVSIEGNHAVINEEAVRERINELSRAHDTFGKKRIFKTTSGEEVDIVGGAYGWRVDRSEETEELIKHIQAGMVLNKEPIYLYSAYVKGEDDIGSSYVELDLKKQHLYLYVEGELILESDFISGNVSRGYATPTGIYGLTYKERDATLKGINYASRVSYWMPFNANIGMHDASWRTEFGGDIYLTNGSHGCVNLPKENAEIIYGYLKNNFPIICY